MNKSSKCFSFNTLLFLFSIFILLTPVIFGCVFVSVPLRSGISPLVEESISGKGKNKILLINISGIISCKEKTNILGTVKEVNLVARIKEELEKAEKDPNIKGIILKINSPGGTVSASDTILSISYFN